MCCRHKCWGEGRGAGVCVHMQKEPGEWATQLTHKFPNMWIIHCSCSSFPHNISFTPNAGRYSCTHVLTFDMKLGLGLAVNVIFFCSMILLRFSVSGPRGPPAKENFGSPCFKPHHTLRPEAAIASHCKLCLLL